MCVCSLSFAKAVAAEEPCSGDVIRHIHAWQHSVVRVWSTHLPRRRQRWTPKACRPGTLRIETVSLETLGAIQAPETTCKKNESGPTFDCGQKNHEWSTQYGRRPAAPDKRHEFGGKCVGGLDRKTFPDRQSKARQGRNAACPQILAYSQAGVGRRTDGPYVRTDGPYMRAHGPYLRAHAPCGRMTVRQVGWAVRERGHAQGE